MRKRASHIDKTSLLEEQSSEDHPDVRLQSPSVPLQMSESCFLFVLQCLCSLSSAPTNHFVLLNVPSLSFCHREETDLRCSVGPGLLLYFADQKKRAILALRAGLASFRYFIFPLSLSLTCNLHINLPSRSNTLSPECHFSRCLLAFCPQDLTVAVGIHHRSSYSYLFLFVSFCFFSELLTF